MITMGVLSRDDAQRLLRELDYDRRLTGYRVRPAKGVLEVQIYSLEDLVGFLHLPHPYLELEALEKWVREVLGDQESADSIQEIMGTGEGEIEKLKHSGEVLKQRLIQCKTQE